MSDYPADAVRMFAAESHAQAAEIARLRRELREALEDAGRLSIAVGIALHHVTDPELRAVLEAAQNPPI